MPYREPGTHKATMFRNLKEAHDWLNAIVDNSYDGIFITDGNAITVRVNRAYEAISGLRAEEVVGRSMQDIVRSRLIDRSGTLLALESRKSVTLEQTFKTGRHALISSTPVFDDNGAIVMVVTNVRDMTELYELKEKYREASELSARYYSEIESARRQVLASADLVASDRRMLETLALVDRVAALDTTVLLLGETGVGKEKIAKYIYKNSGRREGRFITVNCGAIPANLMESELFGYEKGAFTGASREGKMGLFEVADKGILFLDEIGELPMDMQVKLLRVLQERQVTPVGSTRSLPLDVRVLAATNQDLEKMVRNKLFREDLYYRLNVVPITIPPLRERRDDVIAFVQYFLQELNKKYALTKEFSPGALQAMMEYDWPGNVRELRNVVERVVIMCRDDLVQPRNLPFRGDWTPALPTEGPNGPVELKLLTEEFELQYITRAYQKFGNVREAAASLGMDASTFVRKRKKYGERQELQKCNMLQK